ncbi:MAG TPA: DUF3341 domain-containing protein [Bryobacteraceae bacterium]|jgi:hypothetical protein|nr:DUF3341 domain-containing protein [Bryobacteraceae bacterium]
MTNKAIFAIFRDKAHAEAGASSLIQAGFRQDDISILLADQTGGKDFAHEHHTKAPEGATAGATAGAVIGGTLGLLAGLGTLAIPGLGIFLAAGPIMGALAGAGSVGVAGGIVGAIAGLGLPEFEAKRFAGLIKDGRTLLSVHCDDSDWVARAKEVLKTAGAHDIAATSESPADFTSAGAPGARYR